MGEKKVSYTNVQLGGKLNKQKGEVDSGHKRYDQKQSPGNQK